MARRCFPLAVLLLAAAARAADDDPDWKTSLPGVSTRAAVRLEDAGKLAADRKWPEAVESYEKIIAEVGDDLVPLSPGAARRWVAARRLCHLRLAALPPGALRRYRARVEEQARKWFDRGSATRDDRLLQRVVDEAFCSATAAQALDLLGDRAFERGGFEEAEAWWRLIVLPADEVRRTGQAHPADVLVCPDPPEDLAARARAKQLLARLFRGARDGFAERLAAFRALHGTAAGRFAGHAGKYADTLQALADGRDALAPPPADEAWTTFAANPARNPVLPEAIRPALWREGWQWCFDLQTHALVTAEDPVRVRQPYAGQTARSLAFHPVIVGDRALVADARWVTAYDLRTGTAEVWCDLQQVRPGLNLPTRVPAPPEVRFTLSAAGGRVYARMGDPSGGQNKEDASFLVSLDVEQAPGGGRLRFALSPPPAEKKDADRFVSAFEGTPVVHDHRLYVAVSRFDGRQAVTAVHCYAADSPGPPPLLWRQDVCTSERAPDAAPPLHRDLLTLAGSEVVYCSQTGVVVALDAVTGRRDWAVRYPPRSRTDDEDGPSPRDLVPCLYADGRLYAAPADSNRLLCLDPRTGQVLWQCERTEVVQFIGVTQGRLIFTTTTAPSTVLVPQRGIRAMDAVTGAAVPGTRLWAEPADGDLPAFGQGLVAGGRVYWPTDDGVRVLDAGDGQPAPDLDPVQLQRLVPGNLAYGNGYLVVADAERLYAYVPPARQLGQRAAEAAQARGQPVEALTLFRLALAEADADLFNQAREDLRWVEKHAAPDARWRGEPLRDLARQRRYELLLDRAREVAPKNVDDAAALLTWAADPEFSVPDRLRAIDRQADLWAGAGRPERAVAAWQAVLADDALRHGQFPGANGIARQAGPYAAARIDDLIRRHGREVYGNEDRQARALLAAADGERRLAVLERLAREYPNAAVSGPALVRLAALYDHAGRPGAAALVYRRLLRWDPNGPDRPLALAGLARAYEQQHCWDAARATWQRLDHEQGTRVLASLDAGRTVHLVVARELQKPEYRAVDRRVRPDVALPLVRTWHAALGSAPDRVLLPCEAAAGRTVPLVFLARGQHLGCLDAGTGKLRWERTLAGVPFWVGRHADTVLVAAADTVASLRLTDGAVVWELQVPAPDYVLQVAGPPQADDRPPGELESLHLTSGRLFFLQGGRRLFAVDVDTGCILWSQWAPGAPVRPLAPAGRFYPFYHAGDDRLVLQTSGGKVWVLDAPTGRRLYEAATSRTPWPCPPLALDPARVCVLANARHVVLLDPLAARPIWTYEIERPASLTGEAPRVLGNANALLVLVARNYGVELERLDPLTGRRRWDVPIGTEAFDVRAAALDETAVYWPGRGVLHARALADGKRLWEAPLSGTSGPWRAGRTRQHVWTCPVGPRTIGEYPIALFDPRDGRLVERLNFNVTPGEEDRAGLVVHLFDHGAVAVAGDQVWGLAASSPGPE